MRFYLSVDLEGISGVNHFDQLTPDGQNMIAYQEAITQMALETQTVCEAIINCDKNAEIVVNDAHTRMTNLGLTWFQHLPQVRLISGKPKPFAMMFGLDERFDAAMLIGYHAKAGTLRGTLAHSYHLQIADLKINDQSVGEAELNSLFAGELFNVPVILTSGDDVYEHQVKAFNPNICFVKTKNAKGFLVAEHYDNEQVLSQYQQQVKAAVGNLKQWQVSKLSGPYQLDIQFTLPLYADVAALNTDAERIDGTTVRLITDNLETVCRKLQVAYTSLSAVSL